MDMVQCKTTNMIEILKLHTETDFCVLPLCHWQLFAAGRPDGKGHSQRALFTLLPLYWLSLIILIIILIPIIRYWTTSLCVWARLCGSQPLLFLNLFLFTALIGSQRQGGPLAPDLSDLRVHNGEEAGRVTLIYLRNEHEGFCNGYS